MVRQAIRRLLIGEDGVAGAALVEFTLFAPLLFVISIYTTDFGLFFYRNMQVQNAAQAGVDWAMANHTSNDAAIRAAVTNATNYTDISVSSGYPTVRCGCCPSTTGVTFSPSTAPAPCPSGGGLYITVQTQATWASFISYGLFSSATRTLTAQATARIQ
jgi:Flp pilus assembly protein TadG